MTTPGPSARPASAGAMFIRTITRVQVFSGITFLAYHLLHQQRDSVAAKEIFAGLCRASSPQKLTLALQYTSVKQIDDILCVLGTFFKQAFAPDMKPFMTSILGALPLGVLPILLDSASHFPNSRVAAVLLPLLFFFPAQLWGAGVAFPAYWLLSLFARTSGKIPARPSQSAVEAIAISLFIGIIMPTIAMIVTEDPYVTAAWQFFPFFIAIVQTVYFTLRRRSPTSKAAPQTSQLRGGHQPSSGAYVFIQALFLGMSLFASLTHVPLLLQIIHSSDPIAQLRDAFLPPLQPTPLTASTLGIEVKRFFQWDVVFIWLSTYLAGAWGWMFRDVKTLVISVVATAISLVTLGAGAPMAGVWMWKQWLDEKERVKLNPPVAAISRSRQKKE